MTKRILIAPFGGTLAAAVASEAHTAGWSVACAKARGPAAGEHEPAQEPTTIYYDPRSFVSAASLVLSAANVLGEIDAAVLVMDPALTKVDFLTGKPGEISALIEERCSGPLFLAREIVRRFEARASGAIMLLAPESPRDAALGPVAATADGAFEGLGTGLFAAASGAAWSAFAIRDASGQADRAAHFAVELLGEAKSGKAGRWLRYTGKGGIFGQ